MHIPKPLVQLNQAFIVILTSLGLLVSHWILLIPFIVGLITITTKHNPIILFGKRFLKKTPDQYEMEDRDQQLFNQWIATICLGLSFVFFLFNLTMIAYAFSIMVIIAAGVALMGYCIGCTIRYRYMMWKYKRSKT